MNSFFSYLLFGGGQTAAGGAAQSGSMGGGLMSFVPFILIIAIFYFLIIRPQNKKQKETKRMLEALKKGDKIVTIGGVHGTIVTVDAQTVVVRVDDNTKIKFARSAVSSVNADDSRSETKEDKKTDKKRLEDKSDDTVPAKEAEKAETEEAK
jgi:preprotein translocase subunit YajC